jgi:hypothetical protein
VWSIQSPVTSGGPAGEVVAGHEGAMGAVSAAWRGPVELSGAAAATLYDDGTYGQLEVRAAVPVAGRLWLSGGGRLQLAPDGAFGAALLGAELRGELATLSLAAELGLQRRPVDLVARALYAGGDDLVWAARLRVDFPIAGRVRGVAGFDVEALRTQPDAGPAVDSTVQRGWAGLVLSF